MFSAGGSGRSALIGARVLDSGITGLVLQIVASVVAAGVIAGAGFLSRWMWKRSHTLAGRRTAGVQLSSDPKDGPVHAGAVNVVRRVATLRGLPDPAVALVGSVYLDIILWPVDVVELDNHEWADIEPLDLSAGGAAYYVGHYLAADFGRKASLFSGFGSTKDSLSQSLASIITAEGWMTNDITALEGDGQSATSVHLVRRDRTRTAIFTHRGAVAAFGWDRIQDQFDETLSAGGVLFLSGYFKTRLHTGLRAQLKRIHERAIVVADPGSIDSSSTDASQLESLREVIRTGLVDIHIASMREFLELYGIKVSGNRLSTLRELDQILPGVADRIAPIVYLRGPDLPDDLSLIAIADGKVCGTLTEKKVVTGVAVGAKNAFSAALIDRLITGNLMIDKHDSAENAAVGWASLAFERWKDACTQ